MELSIPHLRNWTLAYGCLSVCVWVIFISECVAAVFICLHVHLNICINDTYVCVCVCVFVLVSPAGLKKCEH